MKPIQVFGETHTDRMSIQYIRDAIIKFQPDYLFHELVNLKEDELSNHQLTLQLTLSQVKRELENCTTGNLCDPTLNKDIFELVVDQRISHLYGFDKPYMDKKYGYDEIWTIREKYMVKIFNEIVLKLPANKKIAIVVGKDHLRNKSNHYVKGASELRVLLDKYKNLVDLHV